MKKFLLVMLVALGLNANAQTPNIMHGINAGIASNTYLYDYYSAKQKLPIAPALGYYLDVNLRGRTWLFTQFNLEWQRTTYTGMLPYYTVKENFVDLNIPVRFGFRLGKKDAKFTFFPTVGTGFYVPIFNTYKTVYPNNSSKNNSDSYWFDDYVPVYPLLNVGFEAKWNFSPKYNLALGFNSDYITAHNTVYLKFGWNRYTKEVKTNRDIAQADTNKTPQINVYHGVNAGGAFVSTRYDYSISRLTPSLGYYLDLRLKRRLWLFMQFNLEMLRYNYIDNNPTRSTETYYSLHIPVRFAYRLGKENARFTYYPTLGLGAYIPIVYQYDFYDKTSGTEKHSGYANWSFDELETFVVIPFVNVGFEAKWRMNERHNLAFGISSNYFVYNNFFLKFGWNKYKKQKKSKQ